MKKLCQETHLYYMRKVIATLRNPVFLFMGIITPLMYLFLFYPLLKNFLSQQEGPDSAIALFVPGMLVMISIFGGLFSGFSLIDELRSGIIERFQVTPTHRFALLGGPLLLNVTTCLIQSLLFLLFALPFGLTLHFPGLFLFLLLISLLSILFSSFSFAVALLCKEEDRFAPLVQGVNLPIMLLSGIFLPISLAPSWLQFLAHCNPIYYVVEAGRLLVRGQLVDPTVGLAFLVLLPVTALSIWWSIRVIRQIAT